MKKLILSAALSGLLLGAPAFAAVDVSEKSAAPTTQETHVFTTTGQATVTSVQTDGNGTVILHSVGEPGNVHSGMIKLGGSGTITVTAQAGEAKTEKAAFLGVSASPVNKALREQLKIKNGLVVDVVEPNSPAEAAGIKPQDILEKLDDQLLINPAQMSALVRQHDVGATVTLTILHQGERSKATAKLGEHDVLSLPDENERTFTIQGGLLPINGGVGLPPGVTQRVLPDGSIEIQATATAQGGLHDLPANFESGYSDGTHDLTVIHRDNQRTLTIKDAAGKKLFEGPINTPEQQAAIPKDLQPVFNEMQKMAAIDIHGIKAGAVKAPEAENAEKH